MSGESEWTSGDDEKRGKEIEWGEGDPRVLFVMNFAPSTVLAAVVVYGLSCIGFAAFSVINVVSAALVFTVVTYLVTN